MRQNVAAGQKCCARGTVRPRPVRQKGSGPLSRDRHRARRRPASSGLGGASEFPVWRISVDSGSNGHGARDGNCGNPEDQSSEPSPYAKQSISGNHSMKIPGSGRIAASSAPRFRLRGQMNQKISFQDRSLQSSLRCAFPEAGSGFDDALGPGRGAPSFPGSYQSPGIPGID